MAAKTKTTAQKNVDKKKPAKAKAPAKKRPAKKTTSKASPKSAAEKSKTRTTKAVTTKAKKTVKKKSPTKKTTKKEKVATKKSRASTKKAATKKPAPSKTSKQGAVKKATVKTAKESPRKKKGKQPAVKEQPVQAQQKTASSIESDKSKRRYSRRAKKPAQPVILPRYQGKQGIPTAKKVEAVPVTVQQKKGRRKTQYSAKELEAFRKLILEKIKDANEELASIEERLIDSATGEYNEEDATYSLHMADQGTDAMEREKAFLFAQRERKFISHLTDALQRINSGNYGVCIVCGRLIDKGRLEAVPHARMCIDCKNLSK